MPCSRDMVLAALEAISPEHLAESWDNVGLVVDPGDRTEFARAFVTIDLTPSTMDEADELGADLMIAYHPPIFSGLKKLRAGHGGEALVVRALRSGLTIYSPHTALDAAPGGMADWLARAVGPGRVIPISAHESNPTAGAGRLVSLEHGVSLAQAIAQVKVHLGLTQVRVAEAENKNEISQVAVCPGAGGSLFERVGEVDLLITGEMRHHDVLRRKQAGTHVILTDHTNTERGYLPLYAEKLMAQCPGLHVTVSRSDVDPLRIV